MERVLNFTARTLLAVAFAWVFISEGHSAENERPVTQVTSQSTPTSVTTHALQIVASSITAGNESNTAPNCSLNRVSW